MIDGAGQLSNDEALVSVEVVASACPELGWAVGHGFSVPVSLARTLAPHLASGGGLAVPDRAALHELQCSSDLRLRSAFTPDQPSFARTPFPTHGLPAFIRSLGASWLARTGRRRLERPEAFPRWPLDLSADFISDLLCGRSPEQCARRLTPVLLTHDIDTAAGLERFMRYFLAVEEARGARSLSFVVGHEWPLDHGALDELVGRGHELGIHGYDHSYRGPYLGGPERRRQLDELRPLTRRYRARGYRSPTLLRTQALLEDLADYYDYDSSIPTAGGVIPVPDNGCATARPFDLLGLREIPISLPMDAALLFHGHSPDGIFEIWRACAERIADSGGVVVLLTHCEERFSGRPPMLDLYRRFLDWLGASGRFTFTSVGELVPLRATS